MRRKTSGGDRAIDLNLTVLSNAFELACRQGVMDFNPVADRGQYADETKSRHCRDVAPTPKGLVVIVRHMRRNGDSQHADLTEFLAYTGLRIGEALAATWSQVEWTEAILRVNRSKKGVVPFVLLLPELKTLLRRMKRSATSKLLFPSKLDGAVACDASAYRRRLTITAKECGLRHVTPHGLRSYFVTQARQSGLTDAEIAQLIGDRTGPALIAEVYGDVRPDHLLAVARTIQLTARTRKRKTI